ncbi:hypothetical protein GCM10009768_31520 [Leucobacter iarius]|uniref:Secreted protein n=1 Tax=Leucobacter iarius TaxID=333963 RepID=A0ABP4Y385_9MICO
MVVPIIVTAKAKAVATTARRGTAEAATCGGDESVVGEGMEALLRNETRCLEMITLIQSTVSHYSMTALRSTVS